MKVCSEMILITATDDSFIQMEIITSDNGQMERDKVMVSLLISQVRFIKDIGSRVDSWDLDTIEAL